MGRKKFSAFLCNGLWAYIYESYHENLPIEQIKRETHALLRGVLESDIFIENA